MRASVLAGFGPFTASFEGRLGYMYTDVKGLVTTGVGNLIDPIGAALGLPWKHLDGSPADDAAITQEWNTVKNAWPGVQSVACKSITQLHLDPADVDALVASKARQNEDTIRSQFPEYDNWPADAQLAIHSMAWAQGASFAGWPHLKVALLASPPDFGTAAGPRAADGTDGDAGSDTSLRGQAWLNDSGNPGLRPRNLANRKLFLNAAVVTSNGLDLEGLNWPNLLDAGASSGASGGGLVASVPGPLLWIGGIALALAGGAFLLMRRA